AVSWRVEGSRGTNPALERSEGFVPRVLVAKQRPTAHIPCRGYPNPRPPRSPGGRGDECEGAAFGGMAETRPSRPYFHSLRVSPSDLRGSNKRLLTGGKAEE